MFLMLCMDKYPLFPLLFFLTYAFKEKTPPFYRQRLSCIPYSSFASFSFSIAQIAIAHSRRLRSISHSMSCGM